MSTEDNNQIKHVTVLGGLGFIGSHICRMLLNLDLSVRVFDRQYSSRHLVEDIANRLEIIESDIAITDSVLEAIGNSDTLIHLVHTTTPGSSMVNPEFDVTSNIVSSVKLFQRLGETNLKRIFYVSSGGTVYGIPRSTPITEDHPTHPLSSYGITKLTIEKYLQIYTEKFNIRHTILRPSNVYGVGQQLGIAQGVVGVMINRALHNQPIEIWGTGQNIRDYVYVDDLASALMKLLDYRGEHTIFNIGSGKGVSILEIVDILKLLIEPFPPVNHTQTRSFDVPVNILNADRLYQVTDWKPTVDLLEGARKMVNWLR